MRKHDNKGNKKRVVPLWATTPAKIPLTVTDTPTMLIRYLSANGIEISNTIIIITNYYVSAVINLWHQGASL